MRIWEVGDFGGNWSSWVSKYGSSVWEDLGLMLEFVAGDGCSGVHVVSVGVSIPYGRSLKYCNTCRGKGLLLYIVIYRDSDLLVRRNTLVQE